MNKLRHVTQNISEVKRESQSQRITFLTNYYRITKRLSLMNIHETIKNINGSNTSQLKWYLQNTMKHDLVSALDIC